MEKFLARAARHILKSHGNNLSRITVLMPNHRSCIYFRQALKDISTETTWSPEITTLQDWVYDKSELALIEPLEQVIELYEVYRANGGDQLPDEFVSTAQVMLRDFDEVDLQLADAKSFFKNLENLQSMKVYEPGGEETEYKVQYKRFWKMFRELYFGLREKLLSEKKAYSGMIYRDVADRVDRIESDADKIYFVGFSGLNKSDERIVKSLLDKGKAEIIWDYDSYYTDDKVREAGLFFRKYGRSLRVDDKQWKSNLITSAPKNIYIIGVAKNIGQTQVVADILSNKLSLDEQTERETAVIVPDEKLLSPLLSSIPDNIHSLNISMGYPLFDSSVAELLKTLFALHDNIERFQSSSKNLRFYYRDVFDLLHHPYAVHLVGGEKSIAEFTNKMRKLNRMMISEQELKNHFKGNDMELLFWFTTDVTKYLQQLLDLVDGLRKRFLPLTRSEIKDMSIDIEMLFHLHKILQNTQNVLARKNMGLSVTSLRKMLLENMRGARIPFDGEPVQGLQIMGMQETRSLDFKNVIALSMNEGIFPSGKHQQSYIPYEMQKEFLTTHLERDAVSAYLFYRLFHQAENVFLLYNTESDELGGGEKSRFILQLQHELQQVNPKAVIHDLVYSVDPPPPLPDDDIVIPKTKELLQSLQEDLSEYGISPSAINTYINCSLQYYFRYVAGIREQDDMEENIEAATLGSAVHDVMEALYKEVVGKELTQDFVESTLKQKDKIEAQLRQSFSKRFDEESLRRGKNYLLYRVALKLIFDFLKQEKHNIGELNSAGTHMKLLLLEDKMSHSVSIQNQNVKIHGKVDRVEETNGVVNVVDYKTGSQKGSKIKMDDFSLFSTDPKYAKPVQLLIYAWLYWKTNGGGNLPMRSGIYWLRNASSGLDALAVEGSNILSPEVLMKFEETIKEILSGLLNPEIPFTKTEGIERCRVCEFSRICQRD